MLSKGTFNVVEGNKYYDVFNVDVNEMSVIHHASLLRIAKRISEVNTPLTSCSRIF